LGAYGAASATARPWFSWSVGLAEAVDTPYINLNH
jgi:hypothetical protein